MIGCYHSHPNGRAEPSAFDLEGAAETGFVWLIAVLTSGGVCGLGAYVFDGEGFSPLNVTEPVSLDPVAGAGV